MRARELRRIIKKMKKLLTVCCISIFFIFIGTCYAASNEERIIRLEKKIRELEQRLRMLEGKGGKITKPIKHAKQNGAIRLEIGNWRYYYTKDEFSGYYNISYELINHYDTGIKNTEASLHFLDRRGEHLYGIKITPDLSIPPQGKIKDAGLYRLNRFIKNQHRMKRMQPKDIIPRLNIQKIVFKDNTQVEYRPDGIGKGMSNLDSFPTVEKNRKNSNLLE